VDRDSPLGQPAADLPPDLRLTPLPGIHALLGYHELRELIAGHRLDQASEIRTRASQLQQQGVRRDGRYGRWGGGQSLIVADATA